MHFDRNGRRQTINLAAKLDRIILLPERIAEGLPNAVADVIRDYAGEQKGVASTFYPPYSRTEANALFEEGDA